MIPSAASTRATPQRLEPNTLPSFYRGAGRIRDFRGEAGIDPDHPEDWIGSTVPRTGATPSGLTTLADGSLLRDAFAADPEGWFGPAYTARYGSSGALLTKLLDAGNRLPLHVHPDRTFARRHLGSDFGKSEAWLVLHAEPGASAHLGFARDVESAELAEWVSRQDTASLLDNCNLVDVATGDVIFCPGGVPHAIGEGFLILEIQEMSDFSIMLEWDGFPLQPEDSFLGLEPSVALGAVRREAVDEAGLRDLAGRSIRTLATGRTGITPLLPEAADELFGAEQVIAEHHGVTLDPRFAVLVVNEGSGTLVPASADAIALRAGEVYLLPYGAGPSVIDGDVSAVRCYPGVSRR